MPSSKQPSEALPLERDLITTAADVLALRRCRPQPAVRGLEDLDRLAPLAPQPGDERLRRTFPEQPPFEI